MRDLDFRSRSIKSVARVDGYYVQLTSYGPPSTTRLLRTYARRWWREHWPAVAMLATLGGLIYGAHALWVFVNRGPGL